MIGGSGGIRTPEGLWTFPAFETGALNQALPHFHRLEVRVGFEPTCDFSDGFADRRLRPLGYLTLLKMDDF